MYSMAGHNVKAKSMLLKALEGSAGSVLQPSPCSSDSCFLWHLCVWCFFPRDVKVALWPAEGERCAGLQARAESLPLHPALHRGLSHQQPGNPSPQRNTGAGCFAAIRPWKYGGAV